MDHPLPVLDRGIRLLELVATHGEGVGFERLRDELALPPSTAARLVKACLAYGLLERAPDGAYRVGARLVALAGRLAAPPTLARLVAAPLARLAAACGESAACFVPGEDHVELVVGHELPERFGYARPGTRNRNHHRHGFALLALAHREPRAVDALLATCCGAEEAATVRARLPRLRADGSVLNRSDDQPGIARAVAAVRAPDGGLRALVGVTGIAAAWTAARGQELQHRVRAAADEIETLLAAGSARSTA